MSENTAGVDNRSEHMLLDLFLKQAWDFSFLKIMALIMFGFCCFFFNAKGKLPLV